MEGLSIPFTPALALVEEKRRGRSWAGSPSSHFSPSSQPDCPSQKGQRPRRAGGRFAGRPACYKLHTSSRARVSIHWRVKGTGAFQKSDPKVQQGQVNKDTKTNRESMISHHTEAAKRIKTTLSFFHVSSSSGFQGGSKNAHRAQPRVCHRDLRLHQTSKNVLVSSNHMGKKKRFLCLVSLQLLHRQDGPGRGP